MNELPNDPKRCIYCGRSLLKDARYCAYCGKPVEEHSNIHTKKKDVGHRVLLCKDGKYRWMYTLHLLKNPSILFDILSVLAMSEVIVLLFMLLLDTIDNGINMAMIKDLFNMFIIVTGVILTISFISYLIYAALNGWSYVALFEMDEEGVIHHQMGKSVKTANLIGWISILAGITASVPGNVGRGITSATRNSIFSTYANVRKVKANRKSNLIKVHGLYIRNRIYVQPEDFDFVYEYIRLRCPRLKDKNDPRPQQ